VSDPTLRIASQSVVPAKAGTHSSDARAAEWWIPARAGMTDYGAASGKQKPEVVG
jgi:hypothetical protein